MQLYWQTLKTQHLGNELRVIFFFVKRDKWYNIRICPERKKGFQPIQKLDL